MDIFLRIVMTGSLLLLVSCQKPVNNNAVLSSSTGCRRSVDPLLRPPLFPTSLKNQVSIRSSIKSRKVPFRLMFDDEDYVPAGESFTIETKPECAKKGRPFVSWKTSNDMSTQEIEEIAARDQCIKSISSEIAIYKRTTPNDTLFGSLAHMTTINATTAYDTFYSLTQGVGRQVTLAVIDDGVDLTHEDLSGNAWQNPGEISSNGLDDDFNGFIDDVNGFNLANEVASPAHIATANHGSHVTGLAAAVSDNSTGVAGVMGQSIKIMAINVFGGAGTTTSTLISNALHYAADNGANVVNLSLGGAGTSLAIQSALEYALARNVFIAAAAGNDDVLLTDAQFESPASYARLYSGMISVGSVDANTKARSSFSNYSTEFVEMAAPGSDSVAGGILSTLPNDNYGYKSGTSMATPVLSGAAALTVSLYLTRSNSYYNSEVEVALTRSAQVMSQLTSFFREGRLLDLAGLATYLNAQCPP